MSTPPTHPHSPDSLRDASFAESSFFAELLPPGSDGESAAEVDSRVMLDLESSSPLPLDRLAYGWVTLPSREILYYAAPRDRVPAHDAFVSAGYVVPPASAVMLPDGVTPDVFNSAKRDMYADVRPRPELIGLRSRAVADGVIGKLAWPLRVAAAIAVVVLAVAACLWVNNNRRSEALAKQASSVKRAEERLGVLSTLERLAATNHSVFDGLAMVNPSRPESVGFTKVVLTDNALLTVDGRSSDVSSINRMKDSLKDAGHFGDVTIPKLDAASGRTNFSMKIPVTKWAPMADAPKEAADVLNKQEGGDK